MGNTIDHSHNGSKVKVLGVEGNNLFQPLLPTIIVNFAFGIAKELFKFSRSKEQCTILNSSM